MEHKNVAMFSSFFEESTIFSMTIFDEGVRERETEYVEEFLTITKFYNTIITTEIVYFK